MTRVRIPVDSIPWNLFLITTGSLIFAMGVRAVAMPHEFIFVGNDVFAILLNQ